MGNKIKFKEVDHSLEECKSHWETNDGLMSSTIKMPPPIVGGYDITGSNGIEGSIVFNFVNKPSWFHRTCTRFFLGWKWKDEKKDKKSLLLG